MSELEKQLMVVDAQSLDAVSSKELYCDAESAVVKKQRPKIKRREVVDGKPKRGRPTKVAIAKKKNPGVLGRPPGDAARIAEFKARLLATAGDSVITKIIETALADGHPAQGAMLKFCGERLLPLSIFDAKTSNGTPQISINITSLGAPQFEKTEIVDNIEYSDVEYTDEKTDS